MNIQRLIRPIGAGIVVILAISIGILFGVRSSNTTTNAQQVTKSEIADIALDARNSPGAPILISAPTVISTDVYKPSYTLTLTNTSTKAIRAFTLRVETTGKGGEQLNESFLSHMISEDLLLRPNQSKQEIRPGTSKFPEPVTKIAVELDFVEFVDGTTWGKDVYHSADTLAGQRAGGGAALAYFRSKVDSDSFDASLVDGDSIEIMKQVDSGKSREWKRGFESGVGIVRNRISRSFAADGLEGVKGELRKGFDASSGRKAQ